DVDVLVMEAIGVGGTRQLRERDAFRVRRPVAGARERGGTLFHVGLKLLRPHGSVDEPPVFRALAADAVRRRAEDVGVIAADSSLVGDARQAAGPGQDAEQRDLWQADRGGPIVDENDLVARERELVPAARGRAVERRDELETRMAARVLDAVAR